MGLFSLTSVNSQRAETFWKLLSKPRGIVMMALLICGIVGFGYNLYVLFLKHFS
jgi:hypothetical protein